jgi:hypothetical protein
VIALSASKPTIESSSSARDSDESGAPPLAEIVATELDQPTPEVLTPMICEMRRRHGAAVAGILFYGSCLRTKRYEDGVLDFYVLVDSYAAAFQSRTLAWATALLPPSVFYCQVTEAGRTLRSKYAVLSTKDFLRGASLSPLQSIIWARFCQPCTLVYCRDDDARRAAVRGTVEASVTMVSRTVATLPGTEFEPDEMWQQGFTDTYSAELRVESAETVRGIYEAARERYDAVAVSALRELERRGTLALTVDGRRIRVSMPSDLRRRLRRGWAVRRFLGKPLAAIRLVKSMLTFGDWVPYALWKLERHTGVRIELTEWQRRYFWLACWPVIFRLLFRRVLR